VSPTKEISYFACAGERLAALDAEGRLKKDFKSAVGPVERLIALSPIRGAVAMIGYKNWENSILFLDRQGQLLSEKSTGKSDIDWIAANDQHLLVGFNGSAGLQLFDRPAPTPPLELRRLWSKAGLHNCWNTGLGNFGNGFVAATSETHDAVIFLSADGKRTLMKQLGDVTSLEAVPASRDESLVVAINDINSGREEVIGLRLDRVSFRAPLGKNPASSPVSWRLRRIVPGRFVGGFPQFAVLRGDGSIVVYDTAGTPLSFLPSNRTRQAIELGPPMQGRDTLLACEAKSLSRYVFPMMSKDTARDFATIKNPNAELLKIADGDTADDLWARALWLSISDTGPSPDEVASLFLAALRRAKHKAPIYISFADLGYGPLTLFNSFSGAQETIAKTLGDELKASVPDLVEQQKKPEKERDPKLIEDIYKDSLVKSMEQLLEQFKRAEREAADRSNVCYLAAVTEDPGNKAAWLRLAYFSTGARRTRALAESIRLDPDNAFPFYLKAVAAADQGDWSAVLEAVSAGNRRPVCRLYESPLPAKIHLSYPDHEWLRDMGVVGRPIPYSAFRYFISMQTSVFTGLRILSTKNLLSQLREIMLKLMDQADQFQKAGKTAEAVIRLKAAHEMGLQLMRLEPRDTLMFLTGEAIASDLCPALKAAYKTRGELAQSQAVEATEKQLKQSIDVFSAARFPKGPKADDVDQFMREVAQGTRDDLIEGRQMVEMALRRSGLIKSPIPGQKPGK
jgi:hypothetical protein